MRQIGIDTRLIRRIRERRPILRVGEGTALHHLLHVDDAALGFVGVLEAEGLVEDVPLADWEDRIIEIQRDARARVLED